MHDRVRAHGRDRLTDGGGVQAVDDDRGRAECSIRATLAALVVVAVTW